MSDYTPTCSPLYAVCSVDYQGMEKYLVLIEAGPGNGGLDTLVTEGDALCCDLILYCYDGSDSNSLVQLSTYRDRISWAKQVPSIAVECKADRTAAALPAAVKWAKDQGIPLTRVSVGRDEEDGLESDDEFDDEENSYDDLVQMSIAVAMNPMEKIPNLSTSTPVNLWPWAMIGLGTLAIGGILIHRWLKQ